MYETLKKILVNDLELKADDIRPEATLEEAGLDSLGLAELSLVLSKQYEVEVSDDELTATATVAEIAALLAQRASARLTSMSG